MLKGIGVIFILGSCGSLGLIKAFELKAYCSLLQELLLALELLETEVQYRQNPLVLAFAEVGQRLNPHGAGVLFCKAAEYLQLQPDQLPATGWNYGVEALAKQIPSSSLLRDFLLSFGQGLGRSDLASQAKLFNLLRQQLKQCLTQAQSQRQQEERMWQYLGFGAGTGLILLLL
jgi:stage III sporulation protein AB